jgi:phosphate starvation-inducible protein PhoH
LRDIEGIGFIYLDETDVVRHALVKDIIRAYQERTAGGGEDAAGPGRDDEPVEAPEGGS